MITPGSLLQWGAQCSSKGKYKRKILLKNPVTFKKEKGKPHYLSNPVPNQNSNSNGNAGALPSQLQSRLLPGCTVGRGLCAARCPQAGRGPGHGTSRQPLLLTRPLMLRLSTPRAGPSQLHQHIAASITSRKQRLGLTSSSTESRLRGRDMYS